MKTEQRTLVTDSRKADTFNTITVSAYPTGKAWFIVNREDVLCEAGFCTAYRKWIVYHTSSKFGRSYDYLAQSVAAGKAAAAIYDEEAEPAGDDLQRLRPVFEAVYPK